MASALTANEIITEALKILGNETITDRAQIWLNNFLDRLYTDGRWPFQEATSSGTFTVEQTSVTLPADFLDLWDQRGLRTRDSSGTYSYLRPMNADEFDQLVDPDLPGEPEFAVFNLATMTWRPYPLPNATDTWHLRYKKHPGRISDFDAVVTFPNDQLLIQAVLVAGMLFEDDDRYAAASAELELMRRRFLRGYNISPTKVRAHAYQPNTFRGIGALR